MRKSKKVLSALLAMVMLFSCMSIGANATYAAYKDAAITSYDNICKPMLTTEQYSSMLLDEVDRMLGEANIYESFDLSIVSITLDATSVDKTIESIKTAWDMVKGLTGAIGGDIQNIDMSALTEECPYRGTGGKYDYDILYSIFEFLKDNKDIIKKVAADQSNPETRLNLGMLQNLLDIEIDIQQMIKGMVYEMAYPDAEVPETITASLDSMVQIIVENMLVGELDPDTNEYDGILPELKPLFDSGNFNITTTSFYDMIEEAMAVIWNNSGVELLNTRVKRFVREICGVDYSADPELYPNGDASNLNEYAFLLNIDYTIPQVVFEQGETFISEFNDILGSVIENVANLSVLDIEWQYGTATVPGNTYLLSNIVAVGKEVVKVTGNAFFADHVQVPAASTIDAMSDMQFISFVVRSIVNGSDTGMKVPESCDTLREIAVYSAVTVASDYLPEFYSTFQNYLDDADSTAALQEILADVIVLFVNQYTNADLYYEDDFNTTLKYLVEWVVDNYGGLIGITIPAITSENVWDVISDVVFSVFPSSWLPLKDNGTARDDVYDLIFTDVVDNLLDLDIIGILSLFERNTTPGAGLNNSVTNILVNFVKNVINVVLPNTATSSYSTFEDLISTVKLPALIANLLKNLDTYATRLMPSLLPLLCNALGLSSEQEFGYPYISLPETITGATSFYIYNSSSGLNTAFRAINGTLNRDYLYKYRINSISTNQTGVTVRYNNAPVEDIFINGGESLNFNITGTPTANSVLVLYVNYDVYEETGAKMTPVPMVATVFTYVTTIKDDGDTDNNVDVSSSNYHMGTYVKATYINQNGSLKKLGDYSLTLKRKNDSTSHTTPATISLSNATIAPGFAGSGITANVFNNINTTLDGGGWLVRPYAEQVDETSERPANGLYTSTFTYQATKTNASGSAESLPFSHYVYLYDDFNLPSIFNSAVNANRQQSQYGTGNYEYTYVDEEDGETYTQTVNGVQAWNDYIDALTNAASVVERPRVINTFVNTHASKYETYAKDLEDAIARLEACAISAGVSSLKPLVEAYDPRNEKISLDPETNEPIIDPETGKFVMERMDYYEEGYAFVDKEDYAPYTWNRFEDEVKMARRIVDNQESEEPDEISSIELAYAEHRLSLYADRLIRTRAYTDALNAGIANAQAAGYSEADFTEESWEEYESALNFAVATAAEPLGTYNVFGYLTSADGLRQSKVNTARKELVEAEKRLVSSADYTQLLAQINIAAGYTDPDLFTQASWSEFVDALEYANYLVEEELVANLNNQAEIDAAAIRLSNAIDALALVADYTQLNETIALAKSPAYSPNNGRFTQESYAAFEAALAEAEGVPAGLPNSSQNVIDAKESALSIAIDALVNTQEPDIDFVDYSEMKVLDLFSFEDGSSFLCGLNSWYPSVTGEIEAVGGATFEIIANDYGAESTGTFIDVYAPNGSYVKSYQVVYFGDVDGDSVVEGADFTALDCMTNFIGDLFEASGGYVDHNSYTMACDVYPDGALDGSDITTLDAAVQGLGALGQDYTMDNFIWY